MEPPHPRMGRAFPPSRALLLYGTHAGSLRTLFGSPRASAACVLSRKAACGAPRVSWWQQPAGRIRSRLDVKAWGGGRGDGRSAGFGGRLASGASRDRDSKVLEKLFQSATSLSIDAGRSGGFGSERYVSFGGRHELGRWVEDVRSKTRASKQTGESTETAWSQSQRSSSERRASVKSGGSTQPSGDLSAEGKTPKSDFKFRSSSTRSYSKRSERRTYSSSGKTSSSIVSLQDSVGKAMQVAVQGPKMDNHRGQKRGPPADKDGQKEPVVKKKKYTAEQELRRSLDMCSKHADVMQAIELYDKIVAEKKMKLNQYNFNILLYLCASGAMDALKPSLRTNKERKEANAEEHKKVMDKGVTDANVEHPSVEGREESFEGVAISLTAEAQKVCADRGFEIYEAMKAQGVPPNEATFTAVARLAVAKGDGDLAFDMVKQMAAAKLAPKLRSYSPALFTYCKSNAVDKAFEVDNHMREAGVQPEESELEALLEVSVRAGLADKVYSLLHRLRTSVRELKPSTADVVERWFRSDAAAIASVPNLLEAVKGAVEKGGGGWHGLGWLGKGKWDIAVSHLDKKGVCNLCREKLVTIDIDPNETEMFAESLSKLACQREAKNNEFKKFQAWLDRHGPYDAIVDGANVGLYGQNYDQSFNFHQLNAVVNGVQQRSPTKKEPLIILHHRRTRDGPAASSFAVNLLKKWNQNNLIYTTPTGSNDDWYWLYAAVKNKCLLVTDDEMRDHLFQLLGNDFFPKWKERHQVRYTFTKEEGLVLHMPPPYSIVIQESEKGSWHVPKAGGDDISSLRDWLCITRPRDPDSENSGVKTSVSEMPNSSSPVLEESTAGPAEAVAATTQHGIVSAVGEKGHQESAQSVSPTRSPRRANFREGRAADPGTQRWSPGRSVAPSGREGEADQSKKSSPRRVRSSPAPEAEAGSKSPPPSRRWSPKKTDSHT